MISKIMDYFFRFVPTTFSTPIERRVYHSLIDQMFYKNLLSIWTSVGLGLIAYGGLLYYKHDWRIHLWLAIFLIFNLSKFLFYHLYFNATLLSEKIKQKRFSSMHIMLWGGLSGLMWVFLLFIVKSYSYEAKLFCIFLLILSSLGLQTRYSLLPLWYVSYVTVIVVPLSGWIFFKENDLFLWGCAILLYAFYSINTVYSYFTLYFDAVFMYLQNSKLLDNIHFSNKKILKANKNLNEVNDALILEIKRRQKVEENLEKSATHDNLTGLPNRLLLKDRLQQAILVNKRKSVRFAVFFLDLDYFKSINDTLGHEMGDKILRAVAMRLKKTLRKADTVARIGGDEFVVLIPRLEREKDVYPIARKVINALSEDYIIEKHSLTCPASMGIAIFPDGGDTFTALLKNADKAMYRAKNEGGDRFATYSPQPPVVSSD